MYFENKQQKGEGLNTMDRTIITIPAENGELYEISAGCRYLLASFSGKVEITEHTNLVPILGRIEKGTKTILASLIVRGDLEYRKKDGYASIHSGKVYEALTDINGEKTTLAGLQFKDSDPVSGELVFEITDRELVRKFIGKGTNI